MNILKDPVGSDYAPSVLSVTYTVPNSTDNSPPGAIIMNQPAVLTNTTR